MTDSTQNSYSAFPQLCQDILQGLGMAHAQGPSIKRLNQSFNVTIVRESTDGMFLTKENWSCVFIRGSLDRKHVQSITRATIRNHAQYLMLVVFGNVISEAEIQLREILRAQHVHLALFSGHLAEALAIDYGQVEQAASTPTSSDISFAKLRSHAKQLLEVAPWHRRFQTASLQPLHDVPLEKVDASLSEADLFRALQNGSLLLLGEPGAGKTTGLLSLAGNLSVTGGITPVFIPLGNYGGSIWDIIQESLSIDSEPVSKKVASHLLSSGSVLLLLDGINEIQNTDLQVQLIDELNHLTAPEEPTANSLWVITGRIHDYQHSRRSLVHIGENRWELQPLTPDLIFRFLADELGEEKALTVYESLNRDVRDICTNPLLLDMVLTIYQETGQVPYGRASLYNEFFKLLLRWSFNRGSNIKKYHQLSALLSEAITAESYRAVVQDALGKLASAMTATVITWQEAYNVFKSVLAHSSYPESAAALLLEDLTSSGILRRDWLARIRFFHHTFQEYFKALDQRDHAVEVLLSSSNVQASDRETLIFLAGAIPDPTPMIQNTVKNDPALAFEMFRNNPQGGSPELIKQIATGLWKKIQSGGMQYGDNRRLALTFKRLASYKGRTVEQVVAEIDGANSNVEQVQRLMRFYAELGDTFAQRRTLAQANDDGNVPEELLFDAAVAGDPQTSVDLYSRFLEKNPESEAALSNRGNAYKSLGRNAEALDDYRKAVELGGQASALTNLAVLLKELNQDEEARERLELALEKSPSFVRAHAILAEWIEEEDPQKALIHREQTVLLARHDDDLRIYYPKLADLQEALGRHGEAIRSLRQMIALSPTSTEKVKSWKTRIARQRQLLDAKTRASSVRDRLQSQADLPLHTIVAEWLHMSNLTVDSSSMNWFVVTGRHIPDIISVVLMPDPIVTAAGLKEALDAVPPQWRQVRHKIVVTSSETLSHDARYQLAALQHQYTVALITVLEISDAILKGNQNCHELLGRALQRAGQVEDPFFYQGVVLEHTEFFGRVKEITEFISLINRGQQVGLYGVHKIGKSSLLEQLRRKLHLSKPEITVVQVVLNASLKDAGDFFREVLQKLLGGVEVTQLQAVSAATFRQKLTDFHNRRERELPNHKLLLVLDEYAYLIPDAQGIGGLNNFAEVLGVLKALNQEGWFMLLPCGRTAALNRQGGWGKEENPFIDLLHPHFLEPLPREENDILMKTLGERANLKFSAEALDEVYLETGGHPAFSRNLGSQILHNWKGEITAEQVRVAVEHLIADYDRSTLLRIIYQDRLDQDEQTIASALANDGPQLEENLFPKGSDIPRRRQIRAAIENLIDTTIIIKQADGRLSHRYGLLRRIIQREASELGLKYQVRPNTGKKKGWLNLILKR